MRTTIGIALLLVGLLQANASENEQSWLTYKSKSVEGISYSIQYPADWQLRELDSRRVVIGSPYSAKVCVVVSLWKLQNRTKQKANLDEFAAVWDREVRKHVADYNCERQAKGQVAGHDAYGMIYTYRDTIDRDWHSKSLAYLLTVDGRQPIELGYCSTPGLFRKHASTAQKMMRSMKIHGATGQE